MIKNDAIIRAIVMTMKKITNNNNNDDTRLINAENCYQSLFR